MHVDDGRSVDDQQLIHGIRVRLSRPGLLPSRLTLCAAWCSCCPTDIAQYFCRRVRIAPDHRPELLKVESSTRCLERLVPVWPRCHQVFKDAELDQVFETWSESASADRQMQVNGTPPLMATDVQDVLTPLDVSMYVQVCCRVLIGRHSYVVVCQHREAITRRSDRVRTLRRGQVAAFRVKFKGLDDLEAETRCRS